MASYENRSRCIHVVCVDSSLCNRDRDDKELLEHQTIRRQFVVAMLYAQYGDGFPSQTDELGFPRGLLLVG